MTDMSRKLRNIFAVLLILAGALVFAWPKLYQLYSERQSRLAAAQIEKLRQEASAALPTPTDPTDSQTAETVGTIETVAPTLSTMDQLYQNMVAYNRRIYNEGQENFRDPFSYESTPIDLSEYGFDENVIGTLWIPRLDQELPIYLGATGENLANGVAVLGETSLPVAGESTNVVIAGHRGWWGSARFRDIQLIQIGDKITITTPWETLVYRVCELLILTPNDTDEVLIQPGRQLLSLITCHPYTQNYQRYLVRAELSVEEPRQSKEDDLQEAEKTFDETPRTVLSKDENGNVQPIQVEPVSIRPVAGEGMESGSKYSNLVIVLEKYVPIAVAMLLVLLIAVKLLRNRRKESS